MDGSCFGEGARGTVERGTCLKCPVGCRATWEKVPDEAMRAVSAARKTLFCDRRQDFFRQAEPNDGFYCVENGLVALTMMDAKGDVVCVRVVAAGESFGHRSLLAGEHHCVTATALAPSRVCWVPKEAALRLMDDHPALLRLFTGRVARDVRRSNEACLRNKTMSVRQKLLYFLLSVEGRGRCRRTSEGLEIPLRVNRSDIASLIGIVPETMSRVTRSLEEDGTLRFARDRVVVSNHEAVEDELSDWKYDLITG